MEILSGTDRHVITGKKYTAKIARINSKNFLRYASQLGQKRGIKTVIDTWRSEKVEHYSGMKWHLLHGIAANRRETKLARLFDVVTPTRSLLFGLVNIQPTTEDIPASNRDVEEAFVDNFKHPGREIPRLGHMIENLANFGIHEGEIKFRDGGDRGLERTLLENTDGLESVTKALGALTAQFCQSDTAARS